VASLEGGGVRTGPGDTIQGWHPTEMFIFVAELTEKTAQTTLKGGEGGSSDEIRANKTTPIP